MLWRGAWNLLWSLVGKSPARFALRRHLTSTPGVTFFSIFVVSIFLLFSSSTRYAGLALLPVAPALLIVWRSKVWNGWYTYCQSAMLDDMADIATYYGTHPNGYWVAETEIVSTGSSKTIVGCIGLGEFSSPAHEVIVLTFKSKTRLLLLNLV